MGGVARGDVNTLAQNDQPKRVEETSHVAPELSCPANLSRPHRNQPDSYRDRSNHGLSD